MDLILGRPWHILHSPEIRWETSEVIRWREFCHQHCLKGIPCPRLQSPATQVASTRVESPNPVQLPPSHLIIGHSRMSSASRQPPNDHLIGHGTVPSICCLDTNSQRVEYIHCPSRSARLWRSTFRRLTIKVHPSMQFAKSIKFLLRE